MNNSLKITKATLTLELENGLSLDFNVTPAMLELLVKGSGMQIVDIDNKSVRFSQYDDPTIRDEVLAHLPKDIDKH